MHRIAQILLSPRIGGAESLAQSLEEEWTGMGVVSQTFYLDQSSSGSSRAARAQHIRSELSNFVPDAVVAHSYLPALYARAVWGRRAPVHSVLHSASDDFRDLGSRVIERLLSSRTASIIAVSEPQAAIYKGHFPGARVICVPNGVNASLCPRAGYAARPRIISTIARVASQKRPEFWATVAREVHRRHPDVRFEWWGPLSGEEALDNHVRSTTPSGFYMGPTAGANAVLQKTDILFHPSAREAHSVALLEAAVAGVPVVYADSIARPGDDAVWDAQYACDQETAAVEAIENVLCHWPEGPRQALAYAPIARSKFGMRQVADAYLSWLANSSPRA